jgi:hypothetical protein
MAVIQRRDIFSADHSGLNCSNTGVVGLNTIRGMDVFILFVLSCVSVEKLRQANPPSKESCQILYRIKKLEKRPKPNKGQ